MGFAKRLFVDFFYFLQGSGTYRQIRHFVYNFLENERSKTKKYFDLFMMVLILISVVTLVREVKHPIDENLLFFNYYVISIIFFIEYILRLWVVNSVSQTVITHYENDVAMGEEFRFFKACAAVVQMKLRYLFSLKALIDLVAILPFFHQLRLLRIFTLFRVFKLFRYAKTFRTFTSVFSSKRFEFITLFIFSSVVIIISSVLIYVMEANNPASPVNTLFEAFYWSIVTIATVGYGDIVPITEGGRVVAVFVITAGIAVLAFTTSLVVAAFNEKLDEVRENKIVNNLSNKKKYYLLCGYESIAKEVAKKLSKSEHGVVILDEDSARVEEARRDGFDVLNYDPGSIESYYKLGLDWHLQVKAVLCLRESDVENVYTALTVRSINKEVFILSLLNQHANRKKLEFAGANEILYAKEIVGMVSREFIGQPVAFEAIHALRSEYSYIKIEEVFITARILQRFAYVGDLEAPKFRVVLLGIYKREHERFYFNPIDSMLLEEGDCLLLIANGVFIKEFEKHLKKR